MNSYVAIDYCTLRTAVLNILHNFYIHILKYKPSQQMSMIKWSKAELGR